MAQPSNLWTVAGSVPGSLARKESAGGYFPSIGWQRHVFWGGLLGSCRCCTTWCQWMGHNRLRD